MNRKRVCMNYFDIDSKRVIKGGGGGGCNFSMSDNAPTFRLVFFHGLEPYPYVAKGSCVSLYDTPSLLNNEYQEKIISV